MTTILIILTIALPTALIIWLILSDLTFYKGYKCRIYPRFNEPRTKTNFNLIALILNIYEWSIEMDWKDKFIPKSGIDKEIAEEEKELAELERQKEKMNKLEELKRRKERLFSDIHNL